MPTNLPKEVASRGRIYTTVRERRELEMTDNEYGEGTPVRVVVLNVNSSPEWGTVATSVYFEDELRSDGEVRIPADARERLGVEKGDHVRVDINTYE